jgi:hypothetical protein
MDKPQCQTYQKHPKTTFEQEKFPSSDILPENTANISGDHKQDTQKECEPFEKMGGILEKNNKTSVTDKITAAGTIVIAFVTCCYTFFSYQQWKVMENQTNVTLQQLHTAEASIKIAQDALEESRQSAEEQSARAERLTKANEKIAQASADSVNIAEQAAKKSLENTIENIRLEQRAWVGEVGINEVIFKEGQKIVASIVVKNNGKTPAKNVHSSGNIRIIPPNIDPCAREFDFSGRSASLIQSGTQPLYFSSFRYPDDVILTKDEIVSLKNGKLVAYLTDMITYDDVFGGHHFTKVCLQLNEDLSTFSSCTSYKNVTCNDAN